MLNLSPSLMCADQGYFAEEIKQLEAAGATTFHIDIMDGEFVPNFALSWAQVGYCRKMTNLKLEAHLMVKNIMVHLPFAYESGINKVYLHFGHPQLEEAFLNAQSNGLDVGLVVNPEHELEEFEGWLTRVTDVMVMRVRPGFAGQSAIDTVDGKVLKIKERFPNVNIIVDGAVSPDVIMRLYPAGVKGFVLGTSALFRKKEPYKIIMKSLLENIYRNA